MKNNKALAMSDSTAYAAAALEQLHATLPLEELMAIFEAELREVVVYDSCEYEHEASDTHFFRGTPRLHKCQYRLRVSSCDFGQITLTRRKPFQDDELLIVEQALGALSVHLANATEFQQQLSEEQIAELRVDALLAAHEADC